MTTSGNPWFCDTSLAAEIGMREFFTMPPEFVFCFFMTVPLPNSVPIWIACYLIDPGFLVFWEEGFFISFRSGKTDLLQFPSAHGNAKQAAAANRSPAFSVNPDMCRWLAAQSVAAETFHPADQSRTSFICPQQASSTKAEQGAPVYARSSRN